MLPAGKVPPEILEKIFKTLGSEDERVLVGPGTGIDFAAISFGDKATVASTDPITGAVEDIGFYAVHVNANDIAVSGARPRWFLVTILLPEDSDEELPVRIMRDIDREAKKLGISIVGGHTEVTSGLKRPIVVGTVLGEVEKGKLVIPNGAKPGDAIVMTKWAGLEGTSIIAREREEELKNVFGESFVERAKALIEYISVLPEAMILREFADAMHDPTEGGIANGLHEMADASGLGFRVFLDRIPVREETARICEFYDLDPLALIGSGSLLAAVPRDHARFVVERLLAKGINAAVIGEFLAEKKRVAVANGEERPFPRPCSDELWKVFRE
ncbi:AIR synthase family protein [Thermococcus waiotapuensis]|uniref:AIR synthase family protein n=1 Tax=Thermococcus waiotapuensis TaxID=90909 RepID=A0AAE4T468_9EURY|nr:AIR synthase family protein [Thermococcus waiotapuensis]MDV3104466.1 AIR synthase family protein [Thermococcus waiotapuensis]